MDVLALSVVVGALCIGFFGFRSGCQVCLCVLPYLQQASLGSQSRANEHIMHLFCKGYGCIKAKGGGCRIKMLLVSKAVISRVRGLVLCLVLALSCAAARLVACVHFSKLTLACHAPSLGFGSRSSH
jgi:hypothetical protein